MNILCILSSIAFAVPATLITWFRLFRYPGYLSILIYCCLLILFNLQMMGMPISSLHILQNEAFYYFSFGPLIFMNLHSLATDRMLRRAIEWLGASSVFLVVLLSATQGVSKTTALLCMGPCVLIGLMLSAYFAWFHIKTAVKRMLVGKAMIAGSFLFLYGAYAILFVLNFILRGNESYTSVFFHASSFVAMLFLSVALFFERSRVKQWKEMRITREELSRLYDGEPAKTKAASLEAALSPTEYQF